MKKLLMIALLGATVGSAWGAADYYAFDVAKESLEGVGTKLRLVNKTNQQLTLVRHRRSKPGWALLPNFPEIVNPGEQTIIYPQVWEVEISTNK